MKQKLIGLIFLLTVFGPAYAEPVFSGRENQLSVNTGFAMWSRGLVTLPENFVPYSTAIFSYSIPNTFFNIPGRQNVSVGFNTGFDSAYGWNWDKMDNMMATLSQDIFLYRMNNWYCGTGIGTGMQLHDNKRIGTYLIFDFKLMTGMRITDAVNAEVFFQHFSNGHTSENNKAINFYGAGLVWNF